MNPAINFAPVRWQAAGYPVAWTYHDLLPPYLFPKAGARLRRYVTERPAARADLTIVTNEGDRLQLAPRRVVCGTIGAHPHRQQYPGVRRDGAGTHGLSPQPRLWAG